MSHLLRIADRDLTLRTGDGEPESWFLARNSGKNRRETDPSCSKAMSDFAPERAWISLRRLPVARARRKAVFIVRNLKEISDKGSKGSSLKIPSTKKRSHLGTLLGDLASWSERALVTSLSN